MMGRQTADQAQLFYSFNLDERIPKTHLLRRIDVFVTEALAGIHSELAGYYSHTGRPSIDPELLMRMLIVGYCYGIRSERRLCEEVGLNLAYRWFCRLDLEDEIPDHSSFSKNRHGRFRDSDLLRVVFERIVGICLEAGLVKGDGFSVDASVIEADASRYHGRAPEEIDWSSLESPSRAVREYLDALDEAEEVEAGRKTPKVISLSDPASAWTAKANKRVQFGYGLNYLIDNEHAIIVDVEPTPARTFDEVRATATMIERTKARFGLKPKRLAADTAYGTGSSGRSARTSRMGLEAAIGSHADSQFCPSLEARSKLAIIRCAHGDPEPSVQQNRASILSDRFVVKTNHHARFSNRSGLHSVCVGTTAARGKSLCAPMHFNNVRYPGQKVLQIWR